MTGHARPTRFWPSRRWNPWTSARSSISTITRRLARTRASWRRCGPISRRSSATRRAVPTSSAGMRKTGSKRLEERIARHRRGDRRYRLHLGRDRKQQPGDQRDRANQSKGKHFVTSSVEHRSVLNVVKRLARRACRDDRQAERIRQGFGRVDRAGVDRRNDPCIGDGREQRGRRLNPIEEIGALCRSRGVFFHVNATQAVGKIPVNVGESSIDLLSLSGHKIYGPKGIGALFVSRREPAPRLALFSTAAAKNEACDRGPSPCRWRSSLGFAVESAVRERDEESRRVLVLRERLYAGLSRRIDGVR